MASEITPAPLFGSPAAEPATAAVGDPAPTVEESVQIVLKTITGEPARITVDKAAISLHSTILGNMFEDCPERSRTLADGADDGVDGVKKEDDAKNSDNEEEAVDGLKRYRVPNVTSRALQKVAQYAEYHGVPKIVGEKKTWKHSEDERKAFNMSFAEGMATSLLFELTNAANFLDIRALLDLCCTAIAKILIEREPDEVQTMFCIKCDHPPEDVARINKENAWAFT